MKTNKILAAGAVMAAIAFFPLVSSAQSQATSSTPSSSAVHQDKKAVNGQEDKLAADKAKRDKAEMTGHPNQAVTDEKKVQADKKAVKADKSKMSTDKAASTTK